MIEYERTFLMSQLPEGIEHARFVEMEDSYIPDNLRHPELRLRRKDDYYELTKKKPIDPDDSGVQTEENIVLNKYEVTALQTIPAKSVAKRRYFMQIDGHDAEIDVFKGDLEGLVLIDFEFKTKDEQSTFEMPKICQADVTEEEAIAGGYLAGRGLSDILETLEQYGFKPVNVGQLLSS